MNKYEFTGETKIWFGRTLRQIRAKVSFWTVEAGEVGGWIEKEENLSDDGDAWVSGNAQVFGDAWVYGNAQVSGNAWVSKQSHFLCIGPIGSRFDFTTFFRTKNFEIYVKCGCFRGNIQEFAEKVSRTHLDSIYAKQYMAAIVTAKACIDLTPEEKESEEKQ